MNSKVFGAAACVIMILPLAACGSTQPERWQHGKRYVWVPPTTGTNVGRWVARDGGGSGGAKPNRANKKAHVPEQAKAKALKKAKLRVQPSEAAPSVSSSPPERFR